MAPTAKDQFVAAAVTPANSLPSGAVSDAVVPKIVNGFVIVTKEPESRILLFPISLAPVNFGKKFAVPVPPIGLTNNR